MRNVGDTARRISRRISPVSVDSELERVRERIEARSHRDLLRLQRAGRTVCWVDDDTEPLVTIRIATFNRADLLVDRALASARRQSYGRIEILVVGDATDAATDRAMRSVRDPRVRYVNLPRRGLYPPDPADRWLVAGAHPMNVGIALASGSWIAPCDDDDEMTDDHVEVLLREAQRCGYEMIYSKAELEGVDAGWSIVGQAPMRAGGISHGTVLYSMGLRFLTYSTTCWRLPEPFDWNMWRRMQQIGVRIGFLDRVTFRHYETEHA